MEPLATRALRFNKARTTSKFHLYSITPNNQSAISASVLTKER